MARKTRASKIAASPIQPLDIERAVEVDGMPGVFVDGGPSNARYIDDEGNEHEGSVVDVTTEGKND